MSAFHPLLHLIAAVAVVFAPILSDVALADRADAAHVMHAAGHHDDGHDGEQVDPGSSDKLRSSCAQRCQGQCCATCVQCFTATTHAPAADSGALPVQFPTVGTLLDFLVVTFLNRPPSAA